MEKTSLTWIRAGSALIALALLAISAGCALTDPVVTAGTPEPPAAISARPTISTPVSPSPSPFLTPQAGSTPGAEQTEEPDGAGAYTITADVNESKKTYYSELADENALRVENGATAGIDGARVEKREGDATSLENAYLRGLNAAVLVRAGADLSLIGAEVSSAPSGAGGAFACGGGIAIDGGSFRTIADSSAGLLASFGGSVAAREAAVSTKGTHSPAILASPGGSVSIEGGMAVTVGESSPVLESAGSIEAVNATLRANRSAAIAVDGGSVTLTDCAVSGSFAGFSGTDAAIEPYCVALYCSAGADGTTSSFSMTGGALTAIDSDLFWATNTNADIYLENSSLSIANGRALLRACGNDCSFGWGEAGKNGAACSMIARNQTLNGDIIADELSSVSLTLKGESVFTGTINTANTARAASVKLEDGSLWVLTGNAYLTAFSGRIGSIETNGYTVFVKGIPLAG